MFYVKIPLSESVEITADFYGDEIYTRCPVCGKEMNVEINEIITAVGDCDLAGTSIYCKECSKKRSEEKPNR